MKKYNKPALTVVNIHTSSMLAASDPTISGQLDGNNGSGFEMGAPEFEDYFDDDYAW